VSGLQRKGANYGDNRDKQFHGDWAHGDKLMYKRDGLQDIPATGLTSDFTMSERPNQDAHPKGF